MEDWRRSRTASTNLDARQTDVGDVFNDRSDDFEEVFGSYNFLLTLWFLIIIALKMNENHYKKSKISAKMLYCNYLRMTLMVTENVIGWSLLRKFKLFEEILLLFQLIKG